MCEICKPCCSFQSRYGEQIVWNSIRNVRDMQALLFVSVTVWTANSKKFIRKCARYANLVVRSSHGMDSKLYEIPQEMCELCKPCCSFQSRHGKQIVWNSIGNAWDMQTLLFVSVMVWRANDMQTVLFVSVTVWRANLHFSLISFGISYILLAIPWLTRTTRFAYLAHCLWNVMHVAFHTMWWASS